MNPERFSGSQLCEFGDQRHEEQFHLQGSGKSLATVSAGASQGPVQLRQVKYLVYRIYVIVVRVDGYAARDVAIEAEYDAAVHAESGAILVSRFHDIHAGRGLPWVEESDSVVEELVLQR